MISDMVIIPLQRLTHIKIRRYACVLFQYTSWYMKNDTWSFTIITEYDKTIYSARHESYNKELLASTLRDTPAISGDGTGVNCKMDS
jgi:hypothetical protein